VQKVLNLTYFFWYFKITTNLMDVIFKGIFMLDINAIFKVTYGLYIVTSFLNEKHNGFIANTFCQVNSEPPTFQIIVNKNNYTYDMILKSGFYGVSVLSQDAPFKLIGLFGFKSGKDVDKMVGLNIKISQEGVALLLDYSVAHLVCKVFKTVDVNSHSIFIGNLTESEVLNDKIPLTYDYYRNVIKGKTSKNAPTYVANS